MNFNFPVRRLLVILLGLILLVTACEPRPVETPDADRLFLLPAASVTPAAEPEMLPETELALETLPPTITEPIETDPVVLYTEAWLAAMTTEEKIGQLIISRLPSGTTAVNEAVRALVKDYHIGGFILFSENVQSIEQVRLMTGDLQALATKVPMFISTDEEGGRVTRVGKLFEEAIPSAYSLGHDAEAVRAGAETIGDRLLSLGINLDFAPVADIWSNDANTVIGDRAYGREPDSVAVMVEAAVSGYKNTGILSVLKHFPGHGDTAEDSHAQIAVYPYTRERFDTFEAIPFIRGMEAGADGVMVGHIAAPLINANEKAVAAWMEPWIEKGRLPAVFSSYWMNDVLRGEMGFDGLIITDGLEMKALTAEFSGGQIAVGAFLAGADVLLIPSDTTEAYDALLNAYLNGEFDDERLDASVRRILRAKANINTKITGILP